MKVSDKFKQLKKDKKAAFIPYIPFGFPEIKFTKDILLTLQDCGADLIELGVPFSDPLADGPIIQKAAAMALKNGATLNKLFSTLESIKNDMKVPLVIMTYYNPVLSFGMDKFFKKISGLGVSGIMIVDLPIEESDEYQICAKKYNLEMVFFITPTTILSRAKRIVKASNGFIYYISITGTTGPQDLAFKPIVSHIKQIRKITKMPICVGFGIHTRAQVKEVGEFSDGAIVGSDIVKFIEDTYNNKDFLQKLRTHIKLLCIKK